ncbi:hypothetical protein GJ744_006222 [Endocarpon pusillum]|uniref:Uncharacterized protein n=1 Tax=Endocarpon pusillum TaxID=364733 RepID=A0A8H7E6V4_9EURO|nr:hypothetical protein GJ744_006222 [Endocarpon pusillum]
MAFLQRPIRRSSDTVFSYDSLQVADPRHCTELNIYGDFFRCFGAGRRASLSITARSQSVDKATYQQWPTEFTQEMRREYDFYKDHVTRTNKVRKKFNESREALGGLGRMTMEQHRETLRGLEGVVDQSSGRVIANARQLDQNL